MDRLAMRAGPLESCRDEQKSTMAVFGKDLFEHGAASNPRYTWILVLVLQGLGKPKYSTCQVQLPVQHQLLYLHTCRNRQKLKSSDGSFDA